MGTQKADKLENMCSGRQMRAGQEEKKICMLAQTCLHMKLCT